MIFLIPPVKVNSIIAIYRNTAISERNYGYNLSIWKTQITLYIIFRVHYILLPYLSWSFFESIFLPLQKEKKNENFDKMLAALKAWSTHTEAEKTRNHSALARASCKSRFLLKGQNTTCSPDRTGGEVSELK